MCPRSEMDLVEGRGNGPVEERYEVRSRINSGEERKVKVSVNTKATVIRSVT